MARIAGVDLPNNKKIEIALTYIYGIGPTTSKKIVTDAKVDPERRVSFRLHLEIVQAFRRNLFEFGLVPFQKRDGCIERHTVHPGAPF